MDGVNLLPEDLRREEPKEKKKVSEEIAYTSPTKEVIKTSASLPTSKFVNLGKRLAGLFSRNKNKKKVDDTPPAFNLPIKTEPAVKVTLEAAKPVVTPPKIEILRPEAKPAPTPVIIQPPVSRPVVNGTLHQPAPSPTNNNGNGTVNLEIDLVADKSLLFSREDFYRKLRAGIIVLLITFIIIGILYFILLRLPAGNDSAQRVEAEITSLTADLANYEKEKDGVVKLDQQLTNLRLLLGKHSYWSKLFNFLESNTISDVYYQSLNVDKDGKINLSVAAKDYQALAKQLAVWQAATDVVVKTEIKNAGWQAKKMTVTGPSGQTEQMTNFVGSTISLYLKPEFFLSTN